MTLESKTLDLIARTLAVVGPDLLPEHRDVLVECLMTGEARRRPDLETLGESEVWPTFDSRYLRDVYPRRDDLVDIISMMEWLVNPKFWSGPSLSASAWISSLLDTLELEPNTQTP